MQDYSKLPEEELLTLLIDSNRLAFKQIYISYYGKIYAYALKFTKSSELAEDITQEVFIKVWETRKSLAEVRFFKGYIFTICKNMTLTMLSRVSKETKIKSQILAGAQLFHLDTEYQIQNEEYERLLSQAIEQLPPQRKQIFKLCKIDGKSYDDVACQLGITTGTVNDHIVKATRSVREYLLKYNITLMHALLFYILNGKD